MKDISDIRVLELLASKVCHDLISPIGAVSNGLEIMEEMGADAGDEVTELIGFSAAQANAKLRMLRMAYGLGGADSSIKFEDVHKVFEDFLKGEQRLSQDWDPYADMGVAACDGLPKVLICSLILISEALPKGGVIQVTPGENSTIIVSGKGENAGFRDGYPQALDNDTPVENLDPKLIHPYVTGLTARRYQFEITPNTQENDFISLRIKSPNVF